MLVAGLKEYDASKLPVNVALPAGKKRRAVRTRIEPVKRDRPFPSWRKFPLEAEAGVGYAIDYGVGVAVRVFTGSFIIWADHIILKRGMMPSLRKFWGTWLRIDPEAAVPVTWF